MGCLRVDAILAAYNRRDSLGMRNACRAFDTIESPDALLAGWRRSQSGVACERRQSPVGDSGQGQMGSIHITTIMAAREVVGIDAAGRLHRCASRILASTGSGSMVMSIGNSSP
jgi:hypothetical protein